MQQIVIKSPDVDTYYAIDIDLQVSSGWRLPITDALNMLPNSKRKLSGNWRSISMLSLAELIDFFTFRTGYQIVEIIDSTSQPYEYW